MDFITFLQDHARTLAIAVTSVTTIVLVSRLSYLVRWAKRSNKGAFIFLAVFPLISLFPIPPSSTEAIQKEKREQIKKKDVSGDPPDSDTAKS